MMKRNLKFILLLAVISALLALGWLFLSQRYDVGRSSSAVAKIAIILDDVGEDNAAVEDLLQLPYPLTFSILPRSTYAHELSREIWGADQEVMLHMPMEAENSRLSMSYLLKLTQDMSALEIQNAMDEALSEITFVAGVNNHMGSAFTKNRNLMTILMQYLAEKGLYFIDSKTSQRTSAHILARQWKVRFAARDVFLDGQPGPDYVRQQLRRLKQIALQTGSAVGIGHIQRPVTIAVLKEMLPEMEENGIKLVFASEIVN